MHPVHHLDVNLSLPRRGPFARSDLRSRPVFAASGCRERGDSTTPYRARASREET